jgi:c-di-AMP phosphodiesterase-like protein
MKKWLKNIAFILLLVLIAIIVWFAFNNENSKYEKKEYPIDGVSMSIKEGTLTNTGVTLILKNDSNIDVSYGNPYIIKIKKEDKWQNIENDLHFNLPAFSLKSKTSKEISLNWEIGYGKLEKGEYRIIKNFDYEKGKDRYESFSVYVEFSIE